jgi:hypothetical protein
MHSITFGALIPFITLHFEMCSTAELSEVCQWNLLLK